VDYANLILRDGETDIRRLAGLSDFEAGPGVTIPFKSVPFTTLAGNGFVMVDDVYLQKERERLGKKLDAVEAELTAVNKKLKNPEFQQKAPDEVKTKNDLRQSELNEQMFTLSEHLRRIEELLGEPPL
jgi:valyl-tRNA synthetase